MSFAIATPGPRRRVAGRLIAPDLSSEATCEGWSLRSAAGFGTRTRSVALFERVDCDERPRFRGALRRRSHASCLIGAGTKWFGVGPMIGPAPANWREFQEDPTGERHHGVPLHLWRNVPVGLATKRQLDRMGLRPNGQDIAAQAVRLRKNRSPLVAYFYKVDQAAPQRTPSPRQLEALTLATWTRQANAVERHGFDAAELRREIEVARADISDRDESLSNATGREAAIVSQGWDR